MPVTVRSVTSPDHREALKIAAAFDANGIRVVSIVVEETEDRPGYAMKHKLWTIFGQSDEPIDDELVNMTITRIEKRGYLL